jgi:sugar/nucleoside kinase (ribokinase family)
MSLVAVVGNLARDRIDGGPPQPGGCPFFAAHAFRMLGRDGRIVTRRAERDRELFEAPVRSLGLPVTVLPAVETAGFDHEYDGEKRTTTVTALGEPWQPSVVRELGDGVGWVHVAPLLRSDFPPETLVELARGKRSLSLDGQGLVREPRLGRLEQNADFDRAVLAPLSVLKLSEEEARIVAGGEFDAAAAASLGVREILVTLGSRGEDVWIDGRMTHLPTTPVLGVETTGAGDAFMVAYAVARIDGASPLDAARSASALVGTMLAARKRRERP